MKTINSKDIERLKEKGVTFKKINSDDITNLSVSQLHQLFESKTLVKRFELLFDIIRTLGNPFEMLGNNLDSLREYEIEEDVLEFMAIQLILTKIFTDKKEVAKRKKDKKRFLEFLKTPFAQSKSKIVEDVHLELKNIVGSLNTDFIADTIWVLKLILPFESVTEKHVIICELFNELDIKKEVPYPTEEKACSDYSDGITSQPARKAMHDRIKGDSRNHKKMIENALELIKNKP